jgi:thiosulfate dehydrogenase [quinone] large subunit
MPMTISLDRATSIALAALRIYAGLFWLEKGVRQKLFDPTWNGPNGDCASVIAGMTHAPPFFAAFLHAVVLPNIAFFSVAVEWGETLVGVSLFLGLISRIGAVGGMFLPLMYFLGNGAGSQDDAWFGMDTAAFMMTAIHAVLPTGTIFGLDGVFARRRVSL